MHSRSGDVGVLADPASPATLLRTSAGESALSKVGHELRTPLTGIVGLSQILLMKLNAGPVETALLIRQLGLIQSSARRSLATIERFIQAAKLDAGEVRCEPRPVDVAQVLDEVVEAARGPAAQRGLRLSPDIPARPAQLVTDPGLLTRLLTELVDNAVKFTDDEVRVALRAEPARPVIIEVVDDGPGVPAAEQGRIFDPFERGEQAVRREDDGSGLGLYLARRLADALGARLDLHSTAGSGTTFTVTLAGPGNSAGSAGSAGPGALGPPVIAGGPGDARAPHGASGS